MLAATLDANELPIIVTIGSPALILSYVVELYYKYKHIIVMCYGGFQFECNGGFGDQHYQHSDS